MIYLSQVTHDIKSNTLEAIWLEEVYGLDSNLVETRRYKCRNYSQEQKDEFLNDCGPDSEKYTIVANW